MDSHAIETKRCFRKRCFKCGYVKSLTDFYEHPRMADGHLGKCKTCTIAAVRLNRASKHEQYQQYEHARFKRPARKAQVLRAQRGRRAKYPEKVRAANKVRWALHTGALQRGVCEVCGAAPTEAHHDDYFKPLQVRWLCFQHHRAVHGQHVSPVPMKQT